mmetsp:Transcript_33778/g.52586  ORF Transcript_33778/g.52586 Transcript_33778/m.52586 type:complete len:216 (+) Transcript_33778:467-1114(+)
MRFVGLKKEASSHPWTLWISSESVVRLKGICWWLQAQNGMLTWMSQKGPKIPLPKGQGLKHSVSVTIPMPKREGTKQFSHTQKGKSAQGYDSTHTKLKFMVRTRKLKQPGIPAVMPQPRFASKMTGSGDSGLRFGHLPLHGALFCQLPTLCTVVQLVHAARDRAFVPCPCIGIVRPLCLRWWIWTWPIIQCQGCQPQDNLVAHHQLPWCGSSSID